jgi:hypothetical protein
MIVRWRTESRPRLDFSWIFFYGICIRESTRVLNAAKALGGLADLLGCSNYAEHCESKARLNFEPGLLIRPPSHARQTRSSSYESLPRWDVDFPHEEGLQIGFSTGPPD